MKLSLVLLWVALWVAFAQAWPWPESQASMTLDGEGNPVAFTRSHDDVSRVPNIRLPDIYAVAIKELDELKSEPMCKQIAASLLVNDCQMLEGKNESLVLTDSGRQVEDFVASYAVSLAICDLERGSFVIPAKCSKFREESLGRLPVSQQHQLHVSTEEIDACLTGLLGKSDAAWITYHKSRDQALRFCEVARADIEKNQSILVSQRITKVLETLINRVDAEMEKRMEAAEAVDKRVREAEANIESLNPKIGSLHLLFDQLGPIAEGLARVFHRGLQDATNLQQAIAVLLSSALEANAEVASSHDKAISAVTAKTGEGLEGLDDMLSGLAAVAASSSALKQRIESLSAKLDTHDEKLSEADAKADAVLKTMDATSKAATDIRGSIDKNNGVTRWWPHIVWPVVSLVLGSYLPPSVVRVFGLVMLGVMIGAALVLAITTASEVVKSYLQVFDFSSYWSHFFGGGATGSSGGISEMETGMVLQ